jgi:hypothetical protein
MSGGGFWVFVGQALIVVFGWLVVHKLSAKRDLDKARRELVARSADDLSSALNNVLTDGIRYHRSERDQTSELHLKMTLQDLGFRVSELSQICTEGALLARCRADIAATRKAVTGKHFEDEHEGPLPESDPQLQSIADAVLRAKRSLLSIRYKQFPAN